MLDRGRYYQPTISFPVFDDNISLGQKKSHKNINNISETKNYNNFQHHNHHVEDDESSGMCSPPLWNTQQNQNQQIKNNYRNLSPESKTEAIERGQRELMEMVKNMPESSYELTLKDLVEHKVHHHDVEEKTAAAIADADHNLKPCRRVIKDQRNDFSNKNGRKREGISTSRNNSRSLENGGFYLKMGFPISLGSSKKHNKKKEVLVKNNSCSKVSPRSSSVSDGSVNNSKDWWKKKSSSTGHSECDDGSMKIYGSSSTSSSRSNSRHETSASSCWPFLRKSEITK
ncbi:uncharacterized protein LOC123902372 [Trifolium pratense]|uniref:uncharacterized protein LOC123902372 n=1 Tax=Trifolium pratense TaxID=57577 RepID=UPI001E69622E|nr:uncharacterized protein LOC123902372 [Trifolium pratense]